MTELGEHISGFENDLRAVAGRAETTIKSYRTKVEEFFRWYRQNNTAFVADICGITRKDIQLFLEYCFYRGNTNPTRNTKLIALRSFFRYLKNEGVIKENIVETITRIKVHRTFVQKFTREEILKLFAAMDPKTNKGLRDIVILILGVFCGLRISEIINLNWSDIVDTGGAITINIVKTKHESYREVDLWKAPSVFIRQWLTVRSQQTTEKDAPLIVWFRKGDNAIEKRITSAGMGKVLKKYAADVKIRKPRVHMHMLRATYASSLRHIDRCDSFCISDLLGHKDTNTTRRYIPDRGRINRIYPSLAVYWKEFNRLWREDIAEDQD